MRTSIKYTAPFLLIAIFLLFCGQKITNPDLKGSFELLSFYRLEDPSLTVSSKGSIALAAGKHSGLRKLNLSDPHTPIVNNYYFWLDGQPIAVYINDFYNFAAYDMGDSTYNLYLIDGSYLSEPDNLGVYSTSLPIENIFAYYDDYAYLSHGEYGVSIIDISDSRNPELITTFDTPGEAHDVDGFSFLILVADGTAGVQFVDITDPGNPVIIHNCATPGEAHGIIISQYRAYVADGSAGLQVIDSLNSNPKIIYSFDTPGQALDIDICYSYLWPKLTQMSMLPDFSVILSKLGISIINNPQPIIDDIYAVIADGYAGVQAIRITNEGETELYAGYDTPGFASKICSFFGGGDFDKFCVADRNYGIRLIQLIKEY